MGKLLTVGTMAFDSIETPFGKVEKTMGGSANYICLSASAFDIEQAIVSVVGEDYPQEYMHTLTSREINTSQVEIIKGGKSFYWSGKYHTDMNSRDTLDTQVNVLDHFIPKISSDFSDAQYLMLGNLHPQIQLSVIEQMKQRPTLIVLDTMNYWINNTWEKLLEVIKKVDVITINDEEAIQLTHEYSLPRAAKKIMSFGAKYVIIKKGEHGAMLFHQDEIFFAPAIPILDVCDPTGAGDTFAGGFIGYLAKTEDISFNNMKNAIVYGATLASFCVEKFGAERMISLTKDEVLRRLFYLKELTQFNIKIA